MSPDNAAPSRFVEVQQNLPDAELIVLPDSNHGSQFQFTDRFVWYATAVLDR